ncbi:ABC transporter ATP-binding protein [Rhodococcus sp. WB9]|uniref:ABC transporter ATP-binding protein n=1 Tax=Rhodococcus sp. WB9 TaxID=2594007 RepID=UPI001642872F|nr:ABC transporter ATP-binding protein [Rhodococcus sp. WB9]
MARIRLEGVSKQFGTAQVVREVDLDIADGEFMVLLGPSGCGKSTLLRLIAGLESPSSGRILLGENDITRTPPRQRDVAMVFQSYALYPHLTVAKNIGFPLRARRRSKDEIRERITTVASALGLQDHLDRRPAQLSGGQRQRVALARAMVRDPGAFLMDEPLSNLDAALRSATRTELIDLHHRLRSTFLYVTHDQVEAMTMATRIALLNNGTIEQVGTPTELYDTPRSTFVAAFLGAPPMNLFDATVIERAGKLHLVADRVDAPLGLFAGPAIGPQKVTAGIRPERIRLNGTDVQLRGVVTASENLGSEEILHVTVGGTVIRVRAPRPVAAQVGDAAALSVSPEDIQLFDSGTGRRLVWHVPHEHGASPRDAPLSVA